MCEVVSNSCDLVDCGPQAPLSMGFPRQEYWSELLFPSPGDLPDLGIEPASPMATALAGGFFTTVPPGNITVLTNFNFLLVPSLINKLKKFFCKCSFYICMMVMVLTFFSPKEIASNTRVQ